MRREEHNGPDFQYKVFWRPVNESDNDGDEESEATHPEAAMDEHHEGDEKEEDNGWLTKIIDDWERVCE